MYYHYYFYLFLLPRLFLLCQSQSQLSATIYFQHRSTVNWESQAPHNIGVQIPWNTLMFCLFVWRVFESLLEAILLKMQAGYCEQDGTMDWATQSQIQFPHAREQCESQRPQRQKQNHDRSRRCRRTVGMSSVGGVTGTQSAEHHSGRLRRPQNVSSLHGSMQKYCHDTRTQENSLRKLNGCHV